ncbi:MAG: LytTR family transcriptional regulator [Bacteroidetes bacterium]|nr:MAG: LytTR family transcriptional regulator [Bacteroidota bacterium]
MKHAIIIHGESIPNSLAETVADAGFYVDSIHKFGARNYNLKKHPVVFLDANLPLVLLQDLSNEKVSVILYRVEKTEELLFSVFEGLLEADLKLEIPEIMERLNKGKPAFDKKSNESFKMDKVPISTLNDIIFLPTCNIRYFEANSNYTNIYADTGAKYVSSKNIGYYEKIVDEQQFFRCHHAYLINIAKVTRFIKGNAGSIELDHQTILGVSFRKKEKMLQLLGVHHYA